MSDAPETIWARPDPYEPDWTDDKDLTTKWHTKYRRASLPATDAQALANEKVKALVEALVGLRKWQAPCGVDPEIDAALAFADAALAALEADDE